VTIEGSVLPVRRANVDTDQIIPARYLTRIDAEGMGEHLFEGMPDGAQLLADHPGAAIVVAAENFGCGSSREHAAWAILDRGFKAVIAPSFARIFSENAYTNALVPIVLPQPIVDRLMDAKHITIDVEAQTLQADDDEPITFALDPLRKQFVLGGGFLKYLAAKIPTVRAYEAAR
jgi:3-isopropylmalate/(R)-2-methylmalate dehydratase small subunit